MIIRYAEEKNFIELRQFYDGMCKVLSEKDFLPEGDKGGFPPDEMIKDAIKERNQFIGIEDGRIVAAYIMNHDRDEAYHAVKWLIEANDNETVVLHALRVLPEYGGRGYSKQLVQHAIDTARERNLKSIRLDCIEGNDIPQKMYSLPLCGVHRHPGSASDKPLYLRNKAGRGRGIYPRITKESRRNACSPKEA